MDETLDSVQTLPVLVVGGGLVGLSAALFLAHHGVPSLLVERHPGTAIHPRAMGFSPRTMELMRSVGIEDAIRRVEPANALQDGNVLLVESLVGQEFDSLQENVKELFVHPSSPVRGSAIAQDLLEPVLRARAEQLGADLRFSTELLSFAQDEEGISATIHERESGKTRRVRARFLVAADGSQSKIRQQLGIGQHGTGSMGHFISIIFEAEIMHLFNERQAVMCFVSNETVAIGSLVPYPGSSARPALFRSDVGFDPDNETLADYPDARCLELLRAAVGIPDLQARIKAVLPWEMNALVADRFQQERIFLIGDAARTQPPSGGLGGNTGIAEAHNLAWKLATVLRGEAGEALLATYDSERRPLADYTAEQMVLLSRQRQYEGSRGVTVDPITVNTGYRYSAGAVIQEEGAADLPLAQAWDRWHGQPGTHAPHLPLAQEGRSVSTLDLFGNHFVLFTGSQGQSWYDAAQRVKETLRVPLDAYQIGPGAGQLKDTRAAFCTTYGITDSGAVLVRPDGFIGWRSQDAAENAAQTLMQALSTLLFR